MVLPDWFDDLDRGVTGSGDNARLFAALHEERVIFDPADDDAIGSLRDDTARIAHGMDSPQHPPPMLWSGIPMPGPTDDMSCDYHLVISVGGTKTEFALLRMERGTLRGLDLATGREVSSPDDIEQVKNDVKMTTPVHGTACPTGREMIRQTVEHMSRHLERYRGTVLESCGGVLLSWGFAHRIVRTGAELVGGLSGIVTEMTKEQAKFTADLRGLDIGELFRREFESQLDWSPPVAVANDTVMALYYFLGPRWRPQHHAIGLFINGTGTNFAMAEPYVVRSEGYLSGPGEEYQPERLGARRELLEGETATPFFVNYEAGSIELIGTRTRFDTVDEYPIELNALAGGNAYAQQFRGFTRELVSTALHDRAREGWARATGGDSAVNPGAPAIGKLSASDGSVKAVSTILGSIELDPAAASSLRLIARAVVNRSALHAALILGAATERTGFGLGGDGKPDLVGMEGSVWKIERYRDLVKAWWQRLLGDRSLNLNFAAEPSYNASLPGPLYLAALHR